MDNVDNECDLANIQNSVFGHRGMRGLYPENSEMGFHKSILAGFSKIELDVVITNDSILVVNHDTYVNPKLCDCEMKHSINEMNLIEINQFICGLKANPSFPNQKLIGHSIKSLKDILHGINTKFDINKIFFYVEIKAPSFYKFNKPNPSLLANKIIETFAEFNMLENLIVQSFDANILNLINQRNVKIKTCFLVSNIFSVKYNLDRLNFKPTYYALYHRWFSKDKIEYLKKNNIQSLAWTVNNLKDISKLYCMGVDEIMSDYPVIDIINGKPVHNKR